MQGKKSPRPSHPNPMALQDPTSSKKNPNQIHTQVAR